MKDLERMMEAMSYVDHGLVEEAARPAKRRSRLGRVVLIAACLCLALTGTVLAVEKIFGVRLGWIEQSLNHSAYSVQAEVKQFDMTQFSRELQQDLEKGALDWAWDDWQSMQEYVGVPLLYSELLDQAEMGLSIRARYAVDGRLSLDRERTDLEQLGRPEQIQVMFSRVVDHAVVDIWAQMFTEYADEEALAQGIPGSAWGPTTRYIDDGKGNRLWEQKVFDRKSFSLDSYETKNGIQGAILTAREDNGSEEYVGYLVHNGVLYFVRAHGVMPDYEEVPDLRRLTEEILDSFGETGAMP